MCAEYKDFTVEEAKIKIPHNDTVTVIETTKPVFAVFRSTIQPVITAAEIMDEYGSQSMRIKEHKFVNMILITVSTCKDSKRGS